MKKTAAAAIAALCFAATANAFVISTEMKGPNDSFKAYTGRCSGGQTFAAVSDDGTSWLLKGPAISDPDGERVPMVIYPTPAHAAAKACGESLSKTAPLPIRN